MLLIHVPMLKMGFSDALVGVVQSPKHEITRLDYITLLFLPFNCFIHPITRLLLHQTISGESATKLELACPGAAISCGGFTKLLSD